MVEEKETSLNLIYRILIPVMNVAVMTAVSFITGFELELFIRNLIIVGLLTILLMYVVESDYKDGFFIFNNTHFIKRYIITYCLCALVAGVCAFIPSSGWIYLAVFVSLGVYSSRMCGFVSGFLLLCMSILLSGESAFLLIEYAIPGIMGIILFSKINNELKLVYPMLVSVLFQYLMICNGQLLLINKTANLAMFVMPLVNVLLSVIILLFTVKILSVNFSYEVSDRLLDVIDLEFELLTDLKNASKNDYDHSIFTAVLCSKMAVKIGLSEPLTKALGYYHRIGVIRGDNSWESVQDILNQHDIPQEVIDLLKEYMNPEKELKSRETVVLLFADTVVSSVKYLFEKNRDVVIDYDKLINSIFDKKIESGVISNSKISYEDINIMREVLVGERLFYDFLK